MCSHIHGCEDARVAHICGSFTYTPLPASREALINIVGESAAIIALRKQKIMATPEHPNTTHIKGLVENGDLEGLNALVDNTDIQLPYLVMAASHLTGDSTKIGAMLRSQPDKRGALVSLLVEISKEVSNDAVAPEPTADEVVEPKPKKRRKSRSKAEVEATKTVKLAEEEARMGVGAPPSSAANVDFDRAFNDILDAIGKAHQKQTDTLEVALKQATKVIKDSNTRYEDVVDRLTRVSSALIALEEQLMMTGMMVEPAISKCFED